MLSGDRLRDVRRVASIVCGAVMLLCGGTLYGFSAYSDVLKETLGFSGKEVNLVVSVGLFGQMALQPISGYIGDVAGPRVASLWGAAFMFVGYIGIYMQVTAWILPPNSFLCAFLYLLAGFGSGTYSVTVVANVKNWPAKARVLVSGVLTMFMGLSAALYTQIYKSSFAESENLRGFLLVYCVALPTAGLLGVLLQERLPYVAPGGLSTNSEYEWLIKDSTPDEVERRKVAVFGKFHAGRTGKQLLRSVRYVVMWVALLLCCSSVLVFVNNVKLMFRSNDVPDQEALLYITMTSYSNCFGRIFFSICFWAVTAFAGPRAQAIFCIPFWLMIVAAGSCVLSASLILQGPTIIKVASCVMPMTYGGWFGVLPTYIVQRFGEPAMGFNYGVTSVGIAFGNVVFGQIGGALYDHFAAGQTECHGKECYRYTFIFTSVCDFVGFMCIAVVWWREVSHNLRDLKRAKALKEQQKDYVSSSDAEHAEPLATP